MNRCKRALIALALSAPFTSCLAVEHFTEDPTQYDNLYFGPDAQEPERPFVEDDQWRLYALFGLVPWSEDQIRFAGTALARVAPEQGRMDFTVTTEQTVINWLANVAISFIPFGSLVLTTRSTEVVAWKPSPAAGS